MIGDLRPRIRSAFVFEVHCLTSFSSFPFLSSEREEEFFFFLIYWDRPLRVGFIFGRVQAPSPAPFYARTQPNLCFYLLPAGQNPSCGSSSPGPGDGFATRKNPPSSGVPGLKKVDIEPSFSPPWPLSFLLFQTKTS